MKKRWVSLLAVLAMLASFLTPAVVAEEYTPLTFGEAVTVTLAVNESKWYQFTPDTTAKYVFVSSDEAGVDPIAELYDSSMEMIASNDDDDGSNFCVSAVLNAGETYYLQAYEFNMDDEGSYTLVVTYPLPSDIFFDEYSVTLFEDVEYTLKYGIYPEDSIDTLTWTSSNESVATVDENGKVTAVAEGEVSIEAETVNGLCDQCWFTVKAVNGALALDTEIEVEYTVPSDTRVDTEITYAFTPTETGYYRFYSYDIHSDLEDSAIDPRVWVRDATYNEIAYNDDGGEDVNASVQVAMEEGETYYITVELYDSAATGSYSAIVEKMITADSVSIDCGDIALEQGNVFDIYVTYSPAGSWQEDYTVTSSDETVVKVQDKSILAVAGGEATITVTTDLGLTDTITVTVYAVDEIEPDTVYTLEGNAMDYGGSKRYAFTPTVAGLYTIASSEVVGEGATVTVSVSDIDDLLRYNDTESNAFSLTYELEAGKTYYYDVLLECEAEVSSVDFMLTKKSIDAIPTAEINTDYEIVIDNPADGVYYAFTPKITGLYAIFSVPREDDVKDTKLDVYNTSWELFYSNDDGADNGQYRMEEEFIAGETYYLKSILYSNNETGSFTMRIEALFDVPETGDTNNDGTVNMRDVLLLYQAINNVTTLTDNQRAAADMDGNGSLNMRDALALYQKASA